MAIERFGKYQVVSKIGQGAMGEVYRARDTALNRDVAVKTIQAGDSSDETLQKRFLREARSAAGLSHPNIITVYDFGQEHGRLYMAMELLEGTDLKKAISDRALRTLDQKLSIMEQIASGLAFAHENGVVHRDLKPANVHLQPDGTVKVVDFGLAKVSGSDMTRSGMIMGTPHYMSPEQVRGEKADARSDVFSLGCIFYELVTTTKPFDADSMHAVLFKVLQEEPTPVRQISPDLPIVVAQVIQAALSKDPQQRFASAAEFLEALQSARHAIESGEGHRPLPNLPEPRVATPAPVAAGSAAAAAAPASASGSGARSVAARSSAPGASKSVPPTSGGMPVALWAGIGVFFVIAAGTGLWLATRGGSTPAPAAATAAPQTDVRMKAIAAKEVEIAKKMLESGDGGEALVRAERAAQLDPANEDAAGLVATLKKAQADREAAADRARKASAAGDRQGAAEALWALMQMDPKQPAIAELAPSVEAEFEKHAAEARQSFAAAQKACEQAGLKAAPEFREATSAGREAESAAQGRRWATASATWLAARDRLQRLARLTVVAR